MTDEYSWLKKGKPKAPVRGTVRSFQTFRRTNEHEQCPEGHPMWNLYHKRIEGTTETIICCRECDKND